MGALYDQANARRHPRPTPEALAELEAFARKLAAEYGTPGGTCNVMLCGPGGSLAVTVTVPAKEEA